MFMNTWSFLQIFIFILIQLNAAQRCEVIFRSFGDSHADTPVLEGMKNIPAHLKHHFRAYSYAHYGKLMFSVARDGLNINAAMRYPKNVFIRPWGMHERRRILFNLKVPGVAASNNAYSVPKVSEKDVLYFIFGEIDARHKLGEVTQRGLMPNDKLESTINDLVDRYMARIKIAVAQVPAETVWIGGMHPQPLITENTNGWSPITGSWEQRQLYAQLINKRLKMQCEKEGYVFMDFSEGYSNPGGDLDMTMTDGNHHLNLWTEKTKNEFAARFVEHFERVCGQQSTASIQSVQETFEIDESSFLPIEYENDERPYLLFD